MLTSGTKRSTTLICVLALAGVGACSTKPQQERTPARSPAPAAVEPRPPAASLSARRYFTEASALHLFEIRSAEVALRRGTARARAIASRSKRNNEAIAAQLAFAGRNLNLLPSRTLPPEYQRMLTELLTVNPFDAAYLGQQRLTVRRAISLHSQYMLRGQSPTLRPVAKFAAETMASDEQLLDRH